LRVEGHDARAAATAVRAAADPTAPTPSTTTCAGGTPGVPPSRMPRPPELDRIKCAAMGMVIWPAISPMAASTGSRPFSSWTISLPMAVRLRSASASSRSRSATAMW
jgi:hypothetical protein